MLSGGASGAAGQVTANLLTPCVNWYDNVAEAVVVGSLTGGLTGAVGYALRPTPTTTYKIGPVKELQKTKAPGTHIHHIAEERFYPTLGGNPRNWLGVELAPEQYQPFTNRWREAIPYSNSRRLPNTNIATPEDIWIAAQDVYDKYPDLLEAARLTIFGTP